MEENMKKKRGLELLNSLQCLYQQKIISMDDKNDIAKSIAVSMKTGNYQEVVKKLRKVKCLIDGKENDICETIKIAEGGYNNE